MKNAVVWEMDNKITRGAFEQLENNKTINIVAWFRTKDEFKKSKFEIYPKQYFWQDIIKNEFDKEDFLYCPEIVYNKIYEKMYLLMDLFARSKEFEICNIHDFLNIINIYINSFYNYLKREKIDVVFFGSLPHEGANFIVYLISKILNIKTVIMLQSVFPNKFHYCYDISDFGEFKNIRNYQKENVDYIISNKYEKDLFYMKKNYDKEKKKLLTMDDLNWVEKKYKRIIMNIKVYDNFKTYFIRKIHKKIYKYDNEIYFRNNCKKNFAHNINLNDDFVYFPLHLQPEMTTSVMGGYTATNF